MAWKENREGETVERVDGTARGSWDRELRGERGQFREGSWGLGGLELRRSCSGRRWKWCVGETGSRGCLAGGRSGGAGSRDGGREGEFGERESGRSGF